MRKIDRGGERKEKAGVLLTLETVARWSRDDALKLGCDCSCNNRPKNMSVPALR